MKTVTVRFEPFRREVRVAAGSTLFEAARAAGVPVGCSCHQTGICGRCAVRPLEGGGALSPEAPDEAAVKRRNRIPDEERLACVARAEGDVTLTADYWGDGA